MDAWSCLSATAGITIDWDLDVPQLAKTEEGEACMKAARCGHLEILRRLREIERCQWDESTCSAAALGGHLEVLKYAREHGCPWDKYTCSSAAAGGHMEVLRWARKNGCPWSKWTCAEAAAGGHLEVLRWLREEGCPWDGRACEYATERGHLDVLVWIYENGGEYKDAYIIHDDCREFWETYALPYWSRGECVPVNSTPKPAKRDFS